MKILIFSEYYWPESYAAGVYLQELAEFLVSKGHEVTVQTAFPHYPEGRIYDGHTGKAFDIEVHNQVVIRRSYVYAVPRDYPIFLRILSTVTFSITSFLSALFSGKHDVIYTLYPLLPLGYSTLLISKIKKCPIILGLKDLPLEALIQAGKLKKGILSNAIDLLEGILYRMSDHIHIPVSNYEISLRKHGVSSQNITLIPDWADPSSILPSSKNTLFRKKHKLENKFIILYSGNIGFSSELETVIEAARILKFHSDIIFYIVGDGIKRHGLEKIVKNYNLSNVKFLPFQPRESFSDLLASADLNVITLNRNFTNVASQGKIYSAMSSGRPVIAVMDSNAWAAKWPSQYNFGDQVESDDCVALSETIISWKGKPEKLYLAGKNAREVLEKKFTLKVCGESFHTLMQQVAEFKHLTTDLN